MSRPLQWLTCKADCRPLVFTALLILANLLQLGGYIRHPWLLAVTCLLSFTVFIVRHTHIHQHQSAEDCVVAPKNNPRLNSRPLTLTTLNYCFPPANSPTTHR